MLAHLIAEPDLVGELPLDGTLAVRPSDDGLLAQLAYEAAQQLDDELWLPRRRRPTATRAEVLA